MNEKSINPTARTSLHCYDPATDNRVVTVKGRLVKIINDDDVSNFQCEVCFSAYSTPLHCRGCKDSKNYCYTCYVNLSQGKHQDKECYFRCKRIFTGDIYKDLKLDTPDVEALNLDTEVECDDTSCKGKNYTLKEIDNHIDQQHHGIHLAVSNEEHKAYQLHIDAVKFLRVPERIIALAHIIERFSASEIRFIFESSINDTGLSEEGMDASKIKNTRYLAIKLSEAVRDQQSLTNLFFSLDTLNKFRQSLPENFGSFRNKYFPHIPAY